MSLVQELVGKEITIVINLRKRRSEESPNAPHGETTESWIGYKLLCNFIVKTVLFFQPVSRTKKQQERRPKDV